ncbi:hypothetical protein ABBQ32_004402 [Trebouxia sp. C0010 RCD-2024]
MNNNKLDEASLLAGGKGVFAKTSYITIGTKDQPEKFSAKAPDRDGFKGKQFKTSPPKLGRTPDTYFEKKHPWVSEGAKYTDRLKYQETQPTHKKGFLTSDFSRRDEFSMTFRTEQYRTLLKQEDKFAKKALQLLGTAARDGTLANMTSSLTPAPDRNKGKFLFDLVYDKEADDNKEATFKLARDTKNPTAFEKERHLGTYRTTQSMAFAPPPEFHKPEYARKPIVQDTFYRRTTAFAPLGGTAVAASG